MARAPGKGQDIPLEQLMLPIPTHFRKRLFDACRANPAGRAPEHARAALGAADPVVTGPNLRCAPKLKVMQRKAPDVGEQGKLVRVAGTKKWPAHAHVGA